MTPEENQLVCSECAMAPWKNHCCTCDPCVEKRINRAILAERERCAKMLLSMLKGQPKKYNWAKQNYNAGWDQACHHGIKAIRAGEEPK